MCFVNTTGTFLILFGDEEAGSEDLHRSQGSEVDEYCL